MSPLLFHVPCVLGEFCRVARLYIVVEQKQLEYEEALQRLEDMEPKYFELKEIYENVSQELMRAKEELAFATLASEQAR